MSNILAPELSALESLERLLGVVTQLVDHYGVDEGATTVKQSAGQYSTGTWTIEEILDRADEVLERAKSRPVS